MSKATPPKASKNIEMQDQSLPNAQTSTKEGIGGVPCIGAWICKNMACKTVLGSEASFCKLCSCFICHRFDDNKDASLWLVCASENDGKDCCGSSFHIECLLQYKRVGCFDIEEIIHLDGSFSCASCGKISGILGYLKRQLVIGKDARRVNILCHRIYLTYRLLEGTSRFKNIYEIIEDAKEKLESEVGPLDGMSANMARGLVSRCSAGMDAQKLCSIAIQKIDEWLSSPDLQLQDSLLPAACRFKFADITSSSLTVILKETMSPDTIKGYKLWYWKSREQPTMENSVTVLKVERQILVYNLSPCTEYSFRAISFNDDGILGHSESRCYTRSTDISFKPATQNTTGGGSQMQQKDKNESVKSKEFKIRNIWKDYQETYAEGGCFEGLSENNNGDMEICAVGLNAEAPAVECEQDNASAVGREKQISCTRQLNGDYEQCVKVIRQLECDGHIESDFRKNFLTWYSLRSRDQETRAVTTFIKTLGAEPSSLAEQLVDSFGEIINCKKPRTGFCDKLWH